MNTCRLLLPLLCLLSLLLRSVTSIKCYECYTVVHPYYVDNDVAKKLCKNFDYSDDYITDCGNSTYCRKTVMKQVILHPLVETERGCATQVYIGRYQENGVWHDERKVIDNVYKEECDHVEGYGLRNADIENCYCKYDLCNSADGVFYSTMCIGVSVLLYYLF